MRRREFIRDGLSLGGAAMASPTLLANSGARFPRNLIWGAATSAYQIEGGWNVDGKGESIWDRFAHSPGVIKNNDHGDVACDSYRRYAEDVALLTQLNLKSYRFSISWPRIQPNGRGGANQSGIDYYKRLVDALLDAGIRPLATLYHWDLPQALEDAGGWPNRDTALRFADYAETVASALSDRVQHWLLLNEPKTFLSCGYWYGIHAPGRREPLAFLRATHVANLAQGLSFAAVKSVNRKLQVGSAFDVGAYYPESSTPEDAAAVERWHRFQNLWYVLPALTGRYPEGVLPAARQSELLALREGDERLMRAPLDFIGLNYYTPSLVKHAPHNDEIPGLRLEARWASMHGDNPKSDLDWTIYPQGFYDILMRMTRATGRIPIEITENGGAFNATPDTGRIEYLRGHLLALARAIDDGARIRAYHHWSLLDNFEWAEGYTPRFGLVHVDFADGQKRTIKASGRWFARVAAENRVV